jgi:riboflavin biosynthesis pyrimidine reductase
MDFPSDRLKLDLIYKSRDLQSFQNNPLSCSKIEEIYGTLKFPDFPDDRCYTFGSFVSSLDGRIAFPDSPDGTLVAKKNEMDPDGGLCDYWILNLLRAVSDAVLMGSKTIRKEPALTGEIFDDELMAQRINNGCPPLPLHVIVSGSGQNFPADHPIICSPGIPALIVTSPLGKEAILSQCSDDLSTMNTDMLSLGQGNQLDIPAVLAYLKKKGINSMLIESPVFLNSLMAESMLDELYLNTSGLFIGGEGLPLGAGSEGFSSSNHPHAQLISQHSHSDYFTYSRYRLIYSKEDISR